MLSQSSGVARRVHTCIPYLPTYIHTHTQRVPTTNKRTTQRKRRTLKSTPPTVQNNRSSFCCFCFFIFFPIPPFHGYCFFLISLLLSLCFFHLFIWFMYFFPQFLNDSYSPFSFTYFDMYVLMITHASTPPTMKYCCYIF